MFLLTLSKSQNIVILQNPLFAHKPPDNEYSRPRRNKIFKKTQVHTGPLVSLLKQEQAKKHRMKDTNKQSAFRARAKPPPDAACSTLSAQKAKSLNARQQD